VTARGERWIGHLDMDAFFAAVEQLDRPECRGRPVIVGGLGPRGVVSTASYEARAFGIRSAMPMSVAQRRCPNGVYLPPRFARYQEISDRVLAILDRAARTVEAVSLDEAFFDLSQFGTTLPAAESAARAIKRRVEEDTRLPCSVGVGPNRFLAKLASELGKPNGFLVIDPGRVRDVLDPLAIDRLWGVGKSMARRLQGLGLLRVGDLRAVPLELLVREFGSAGRRLKQLASGIDETPLRGEMEAKSISREVTFPYDLADLREVESEVRRLARGVASQMRAERLVGRTVRIKLRYPDFRTITRQAQLGHRTDSVPLIEAHAVHLLHDRTCLDEGGIRLIGVAVADLSDARERQLPLFPERPG